MRIEFSQMENPQKPADKTICFTGLDDMAIQLLAQAGSKLRQKISRLTLEITAYLATHSGANLFMVDVSNGDLPAELSKCLSQHRGGLWFDDFNLTPESARALAPHKGTLIINNLDGITTKIAAILSATPSNLVFQSPQDVLKAEVAEQLADHKGDLVFWLKSLNGQTARALIRHKGPVAVLRLRQLSPSVATILARHPHQLSIGVRRLSGPVASALAKHTGGHLGIDTTHLTATVARELAAYSGTLNLSNLRSIPESVLTELCLHQGNLTFSYLKNVTNLAVSRLAQKPGGLGFWDKALSEGCCRALVQHRGKLTLGRHNNLSLGGATALLKHPGPIEISQPQDMSPQVRAILKKHHAIKIS